jgi:hypothetical protein
VEPNTFHDAAPALVRAIAACKKRGASALDLPGGRIDLWPENAFHRTLYISNCTEDDTLSKVKAIGFLLDGFKDFTIRGHRTLVVLHGKMVSFAFLHCRNIALRDIRFDYERPTISEMTVRSVDSGMVVADVQRDSKYYIDDTGRIHFYGLGWETRHFHTVVFDPVKETMTYGNFQPFLESRAVALSPCRVHFQGDFRGVRFKPGDVLTFRDPYRDNAGGFIDRSQGVTLDDVDMYFMHGLGIVAQYTQDITLRGVRVAPRPGSGRVISAFADCFHFSGCRGDILLDSCVTSGSHDDPINVHGTHLRIIGMPSARRLRLRFMHPQSWGFQAFFEGDSIAFVDPNTLLPLGYARVRGVRMVNRREQEIDLDTALPAAILKGDCVENLTWTPNVTIRNCHFEHTNARGVLVTTRRRVLIEHNVFYRIGMHAILIADDASSWYESGPVRDVTIRDNQFIECAYNSAPDNYVVAIEPDILRAVPGEYVHRNIRIEDNTFRVFDGALLSAQSVDGLTFIRNTIAYSHFLPGDTKRTPFRITGCRNVVLQKPLSDE